MAAALRGTFLLLAASAHAVVDPGTDDALQLVQLTAATHSLGVEEVESKTRGYFYDDVVDGRDPRSYEPPAIKPEAQGPWADGSPGSRVIVMNGAAQGISAIDDVSLKIKILLMLASTLHAVPASSRPRELLGGIWGNSTTDSWDDYVASTPQLRHVDEISCVRGQAPIFLRDEHWLGELDPGTQLALFDHSRPLCLVVNFLIFQMRPDWRDLGFTYEWGLVMGGHDKVQLWRSSRIMDLMASARRQVPMLQEEYNVAHVRRGDYRHNCTSVERVLERMRKVDTSRPWLVMTNAEEAWLSDFKVAARAAGVRNVVEGELQALEGLDDNFMRYQVLQCLYGHAVNRFYTLKSMQGYCRVPGQRVEMEDFGLCRGAGGPSHRVIAGNSG